MKKKIIIIKRKPKRHKCTFQVYDNQSTGNGTGGLGLNKNFFWISSLTIFVPLCSVSVKRVRYHPQLFFPWTMSLVHPAHLVEVRTPLDISAVDISSNTTSLFQPMDQMVIATIKA